MQSTLSKENIGQLITIINNRPTRLFSFIWCQNTHKTHLYTKADHGSVKPSCITLLVIISAPRLLPVGDPKTWLKTTIISAMTGTACPTQITVVKLGAPAGACQGPDAGIHSRWVVTSQGLTDSFYDKVQANISSQHMSITCSNDGSLLFCAAPF